MIDNCRLCDALSREGQKRPENYPLLESQHFVVIPTVGQFVEGWVMAVSRSHRGSLQQHTREELEDLRSILKQAVKIVQATYGQAIVFEHGPSDCLTLHGGCSIDHTHVHIAPCRAVSYTHLRAHET